MRPTKVPTKPLVAEWKCDDEMSWNFQALTRITGLEFESYPGEAVLLSILTFRDEQLETPGLVRNLATKMEDGTYQINRLGWTIQAGHSLRIGVRGLKVRMRPIGLQVM